MRQAFAIWSILGVEGLSKSDAFKQNISGFQIIPAMCGREIYSSYFSHVSLTRKAGVL